MPSERSLFRKIQSVIDIAKSSRTTSLLDLSETVKGRSPEMFVTTHYVPEEDKFVSEVSAEAIKRAVTLCRVLELLTNEGTLTLQGREAARRSRFNATLAEQVRSMLARNGVRVAAVNAMIRAMLRAQPPVLPTAEVLWDELQPEISRGVFSKLLTLLVHCECGQSSQKKVYLGFS